MRLRVTAVSAATYRIGALHHVVLHDAVHDGFPPRCEQVWHGEVVRARQRRQALGPRLVGGRKERYLYVCVVEVVCRNATTLTPVK